MRIFDISVPIWNSMHVYAGDGGVDISRSSDLDSGDEMTISNLRMGAHTGTHVDAPLHFVRGGSTVDQFDLQTLIGPAHVVDLTHVERHITARDLQASHLPRAVERLLCKTRNAALWQREGFQEGFVALSPDAAEWVLDHGVKLIGIDYLSIEPFGVKDYEVHRALLGAGVIAVEGLDLSAVPAGEYELVCLPLKIKGAEGAPARAVLIER